MKIAIPIANEKLCMHFGHCEAFAILTVDPQTQQISEQENLVPPMHEPGVLPAWLGEMNVDVIIAGGMGQRAQQLFTNQNISVVVGAPSDSPQALVKSHLAGTLQSGDNICDH